MVTCVSRDIFSWLLARKEKRTQEEQDWTDLKDTAVPDPSPWPATWGVLNRLARIASGHPPPLIRKNNSSVEGELCYYWKEGKDLGRQKQWFFT